MTDVDRIFVIDRDTAWCSHVASVLDGPADIDGFADVGAFLTANGGDVGAWGGGCGVVVSSEMARELDAIGAFSRRQSPAVLIVARRGDGVDLPVAHLEAWRCVQPISTDLRVHWREFAMERLPKTRERKRALVRRLAERPRMPSRLLEALVAAVEFSTNTVQIAARIHANIEAARKLVARLREWFGEPRLDRLVDDVDEALCGRGPLVARLGASQNSSIGRRT